jgi:hypothetical protein
VLVVGDSRVQLCDLVLLQSQLVHFILQAAEGSLELYLVAGQLLAALLEQVDVVLLELYLLSARLDLHTAIVLSLFLLLFQLPLQLVDGLDEMRVLLLQVLPLLTQRLSLLP